MLVEIADADHAPEFRCIDEVVVLAVALARPGTARGERDRQAQRRVAREHGIDDARLARARRRRDDEKRSTHVFDLPDSSLQCQTDFTCASTQPFQVWVVIPAKAGIQ
jgi:hypothetical protein